MQHMTDERHNAEGYYDPTPWMAIENIEIERGKKDMSIKRGDIYYIESYKQSYESGESTGRPAVIVSSDKSCNGQAVEVVYLTTNPKEDLATHVRITGTGVTSTALCEQISSVNLQRLMSCCGSCSEREMKAIDIAMMISLGLESPYEDDDIADSEAWEEAEKANEENAHLKEQLTCMKAERDMLKSMYGDLLQQIMCNAKERTFFNT